MKLSRFILTSSLALSALFASAQTKEVTVTEDTFKPHWYIQAQFGAQETLGEATFSDMLSPNAQLGVGYNFSPVLGARLAVNAWQSKAGIKFEGVQSNWKWNYVAPMLDLTVDMTNLIGGYSPTRKWQAGIFAGLGANIGWGNDEAAAVKKTFTDQDIQSALGYLWEGTKTRFVGHFGAYVDYNISKKVAIGLELQANTLSDKYNSKIAHNADLYFNGLVGIKYTFGSKTKKHTYTQTVPAIVDIDTVYIERVIEKKVEAPAKVEKVVKLRRDIFFKISKTIITKEEMRKVGEIAGYLYAYPNAKVHVMGYADKGTGSKSLNLRLSERRANAVVDALVNTFAIDRSRIIVDSMDENMEQPYATPEENRVAICVAE